MNSQHNKEFNEERLGVLLKNYAPQPPREKCDLEERIMNSVTQLATKQASIFQRGMQRLGTTRGGMMSIAVAAAVLFVVIGMSLWRWHQTSGDHSNELTQVDEVLALSTSYRQVYDDNYLNKGTDNILETF